MSNLCTCHIDRSSCEWCRVQTIKSFFQKQQREKPSSYVGEMLWMATKLEDYMIKAVARQLREEPQFSDLDWLKGFDDYGNTCGTCKFLSAGDDYRCTKRNIHVKNNSPKCPQWRYFA